MEGIKVNKFYDKILQCRSLDWGLMQQIHLVDYRNEFEYQEQTYITSSSAIFAHTCFQHKNQNKNDFHWIVFYRVDDCRLRRWWMKTSQSFRFKIGVISEENQHWSENIHPSVFWSSECKKAILISIQFLWVETCQLQTCQMQRWWKHIRWFGGRMPVNTEKTYLSAFVAFSPSEIPVRRTKLKKVYMTKL